MKTLVGGIIPVVSEKCDFDYRYKSILRNIFWKFLTIRNMMERLEALIFQLNHLPQMTSFSGTFMEEINFIDVEK